MKLYNTPRGILIDHEDRQVLYTECGWDELINRDGLLTHLSERHRALPAAPDLIPELAKSALPPLAGQELWASGVTYLRSKIERQEESRGGGGSDFYQRVYEAERPE